MGQAKARGSKDQRVAEAVERARVAEIARREQARGDKPLPERVQLVRGRTQRLSTLLAVASIAMLASR